MVGEQKYLEFRNHSVNPIWTGTDAWVRFSPECDGIRVGAGFGEWRASPPV
jgi:hypothetical protein